MRAQAFYILQDPYANAYSSRWRDVDKLSKADRVIGRGGWVANRNYELDSGAYFLLLELAPPNNPAIASTSPRPRSAIKLDGAATAWRVARGQSSCDAGSDPVHLALRGAAPPHPAPRVGSWLAQGGECHWSTVAAALRGRAPHVLVGRPSHHPPGRPKAPVCRPLFPERHAKVVHGRQIPICSLPRNQNARP